MISRAAIEERVREWGLSEEVVEKDYVLGWILWGIGSDTSLNTTWIFKGGTCLKKCFIETYRFSEDLDFTVMPGGPIEAGELAPILEKIHQRIYDAVESIFAIGSRCCEHTFLVCTLKDEFTIVARETPQWSQALSWILAHRKKLRDRPSFETSFMHFQMNCPLRLQCDVILSRKSSRKKSARWANEVARATCSTLSTFFVVVISAASPL